MNEYDKRRYEAFEEFARGNSPDYIIGVVSDILDSIGVILHYEPDRCSESVAHLASSLLDLAIELRNIDLSEKKN